MPLGMGFRRHVFDDDNFIWGLIILLYFAEKLYT